MTTIGKLLAAAGGSAIALAIAAPAYAAGTQAGTTITNTVSVNYRVGNTPQTAQAASNSISVDRKVVVTVTGAAATTSVSPGQTAAAVVYGVTNASNDTLDFSLALVQPTSGTAVHGGTDAFDTSNVRFYLDTNSNNAYDPGTDTLVTYLDEVAPDASRTLLVISDVPISTVNGQVSGNTLTVTAAAGGSAGNPGSVLTATSGANTAGIDTVFADAAGATDLQYDGKYSARNDYTIAAPVLTITKTSRVISDPFSGTTNPKAIPGAVLEYCVIVANAAGAATATNLTVTDPLPATVAYSTAYGAFVNGTVTGSTCNANGTAGGTYDSGTTTVSGALADLAGGSSETLRFRATIN